MDITTPHINSYSALNAYTQQYEQAGRQIASPDVVEQEGTLFQEEMMMQENFQLEPRGKAILNGKEKATLHALFGAEKPSEMTLYGRTKLQHIYTGQLLDIKG